MPSIRRSAQSVFRGARKTFRTRTAALRCRSGEEMYRPGALDTIPSEPQHSEHEKQSDRNKGGDQQRAETAQAVREKEEHVAAPRSDATLTSPTRERSGMPVALPPSSVVENCADQLGQCLVLGAASARAKELSDLRERSPPAGAAVRLVLHHRHTRLGIPDQPPDVAIGTFVENSRRHAVQQFWPGGVPT